MDAGVLWNVILLIVLLVLSAVFSASETALSVSNKIRMRALADDGDKKAARVLKLLENPDRMLSAILIGNNIVNLYASSIATTIAYSVWGNESVALITGILTFVVLVFGEVTPKSIATRYADKISRNIAGPINVIATVLTPVIIIINFISGLVMRVFGVDPNSKNDVVTEEELMAMVEVSHEDGVIEPEEKEMITNVVDFGDTVAKDIMVPHIDMVTIEKNATLDELLTLIKKEKYTRFPVYEDNPDNIVGIFNVKDLLVHDREKRFSIADYMREAFFTYEQKKTSELLMEMKKDMESMAIVLDEYGACAGLITMEDLLEEIVGEIRDEYDYDEKENIIRVNDVEYIIDGATKPEEINERFDLGMDEETNESVAGEILEKLGHLPEVGDEACFDGYRMVVEAMDNFRIERVRLYLNCKKD